MDAGARTEKLVVLHTNDLHSFFEQMPKVASAFKARAAFHADAHLLKLDIGDHLDRVRLETEGSEGQANLEIMNATGYEYVVLGNNEGLTFTPSWLANLYPAVAQFTVIGSNIFETPSMTHPAWMAANVRLTKGRLRIGLIGVTASYNDFYSLLGWHIASPYEVVQQHVQELRPQVDLLILMSHLGLGHDQEIARTIPGIDCILGGHTHHLLEQPLVINQTYICAAGKFGHQIGEIEFSFRCDEQGLHTLLEVHGRTIPVQPFPADEEILNIWQRHRMTSERTLQVPILELREPLHNDWFGESVMGNLLADSLREWVDAELAMVNAGQLLHPLAAGPLNRQTLLELCPSPINPCRMWLKGSAIREALEQSLLDDFMNKPIQGFGFRGKVLGTLCVNGLTITYHPQGPPLQRIKTIRCNGQPLDDEREYCVATIDMFTFGIGYLSIRDGREPQFYLPEFIRDLFIHQLQQPGSLEHAKQRRWHPI